MLPFSRVIIVCGRKFSEEKSSVVPQENVQHTKSIVVPLHTTTVCHTRSGGKSNVLGPCAGRGWAGGQT